MGKPSVAPVTDPLLAALIAKLPTSGTIWPPDRRAAWLQMMWMAFSVVYEGADGELRPFVPAGEVSRIASRAGLDDVTAPAVLPAPKPAPRAPHVIAGQDYYVDKDGFARCDYEFIDGVPVPNPGRRVFAAEAAGAEIYDYRGAARDRSTVVWADESVGAIPGMNFCGPG